jgi:putative glycosyltransferase (TIGR04372 family)
MRDLDLAPWRHIVVLSRQDKVANFAYLKYLSQYVIVVTDPDLIERFEPLVTVCGFRFSNLFPLAGDEPKSTSEIGNAITARCEMAGIGALLALDPRDREAGRSALEKFGVKHNDWFVCLHVREMGYHVGADQNHRNAAIETYFLAIEAITRRGGWVIRLGDASMSTLPKMERVIDYPHTDLKSPAMDVFLCAECHFMIGMNSGLSNVPYSFGRPVVMINWVNTGSLPSYPRDGLFLPKLIYSDAEKRPLSFREALSPEWRARSYSAAKLRENGARLVDNTPSEIKDVVLEMLARLNGTQEVTKDHQQLDERFLSLLEKDPLRGIAKIGSAFLKTHQSLL